MQTLITLVNVNAAGIQAVASVLSLVAIVLLFFQVQQTSHWNRVNAAFELEAVERFARLESNAKSACRSIGVRFPAVLTPEDAKRIRKNGVAYESVKDLATMVDRFAVGYSEGYFHKRAFEEMYGPWICGYFAYLAAYIHECRSESDGPQPNAYKKLEDVARELSRNAESRAEDVALRRRSPSSLIAEPIPSPVTIAFSDTTHRVRKRMFERRMRRSVRAT